MRNIFFHEDDYCQIEILPKENYNYCLSQCGNIEDFANDHMDVNGLGYTDIYIRENNAILLSTLTLTKDYLKKCMENIFPKFDKVETGYSSYCIEDKNTCAYGFNENVIAFFDYDENDIVQNIWLILNIYEKNDIKSAEKLLHKLSETSDLLLVDWGWSEVYLLTDTESIGQYLGRRENIFNS
ncbi:hypothetical protein [Clostridium sp. JS66]|uniref:hypothetical protein n=1 Tax=Clostridium sp. JS66 TaxID=3064705 RepID=UPI00298DF3E8|nr:hypothetical protein [Clostridium sp. JS66]WPC42698.1 hypothetical protein Q6H37_04290 [Clostridium sp. JS66]